MRVFETLGKRKAVLGMVHLPPLPGTPFYEEGSFARTLEIFYFRCLRELPKLASANTPSAT